MVEIPVVDLRLAGAQQEESARLRDACERLGCFRVSGHGVPRALQAEMKAAVRALFDLPDEAKRRNADIIAGSGYVAPSPANPLYEAFGLLDAADPADVDAFCARLDAPPRARSDQIDRASLGTKSISDPPILTSVRANLSQGDRQKLRRGDARADRGRRRQGGREPGAGGPPVPGLAVPVPHQQVQLHAGHRGLLGRADPHGLRLPHRAPGGRLRRRPRGAGPRHRRVRPRRPRPRLLPRQHRRRRHGVEQREAAHREAPGAVRGGGAAHLDRHVSARAQGRQGVRAGGVRRHAAPAPVQGVQL
uniref:Non-haem dioxygenase N-terminal domain-containing protein n=1 Tax=Aegilops tauschii subsp. strangulata TaxID=200361 RepID=A0A453C6Z7_AEGTS